MSDPSLLSAFFACTTFAVAGGKRNKKGFGNAIIRELVGRGYGVTPVHPEACELEGLPTAKGFGDLPTHVEAAIIALPKPKALEALRQAADAGIPLVWLQQGSQTPDAIRLAHQRGIQLIHGKCLFMHLPHTRGIHAFHRGVMKLLGRF